MIINNLHDLEVLIKLLKLHDIPLFKLDGLEITMQKNSNINSVLKEEEKKKPAAIFDDPDFYAGIPFHTKMREE